MISFASLFLGLVLGPQIVEVAVSEEVAAVEVRVDDRLCGTLSGRPWSLRCDLGPGLAPRRLTAVAFDRRGRELGRASQRLNLPRPPAEATLVLEKGRDGRGTVARLAWESLAAAGQPTVRLSFDGRRLEVDDPRRFELPAHDPRKLHLLRAELDFSQNLTSVAELAFGGTYGDRVSSELTAVAVILDRPRRRLGARDLEGLFQAGGSSLRVAAVEKGEAEVVVVRDRGIQEELLAAAFRGLRVRTRIVDAPMSDPARQSLPRPGSWRLQFLWPAPRRVEGTLQPYDLFPHSDHFTAAQGSLPALIGGVSAPDSEAAPQRLADAVTVAGVTAAAGNRRRAVVLVTGSQPPDASRIPPQVARRYLTSIGVPLHVWTPTAATDGAWGPAREVTSWSRLSEAARDLLASLERQRIVWLEGAHLPQEIRLSPRARGLRAVGGIVSAP